MRFIGVILADTARAYLFRDWFWHGGEWMPKSQTTILRDPDTFEVVVDASDWISKQKKLREFAERTQQEIEDNGPKQQDVA